MFLFDSQGDFGQVPLTLSVPIHLFHQSNLLVRHSPPLVP